ncbi:hypothetical protein CYLTODRAFT_487823 [Cylindrobasidium torrendii FP15055 ss-10]|uniref:Uncharacterized protein n=1 Tax=Cylindrobasidium torrendii FP15055 ss-10 TaxID=1314674 RepID=A0A0D7BMJ1_9AGAR|nr:hypothetical protein CYLTODRAFT_487823 [Cylindrobasidium torrendii FP15055 ss-10]
MNVDYCLSCERGLDGPYAYCSDVCRGKAAHQRLDNRLPQHSKLLLPTSIHILSSSTSISAEDEDEEPIYHSIREVGHQDEDEDDFALEDEEDDYPLDELSTGSLDRIEAWRANVEPEKAAPESGYRRPPALLQQRRCVPPTVCMSKPEPESHPTPRFSCPAPLKTHSTFISTIAQFARRLHCPLPTAPVMLSPSVSTDSFTPSSSVCSSPVECPSDPWWLDRKDPAPEEASSSSISQSIDIKHPSHREPLQIQFGGLRLRPTQPPPQPVVLMREDHPAFRGRQPR